MSKAPDILVLGGGISGLAAAYFLSQRVAQQARILVAERASRCGGWIDSSVAKGFFFEKGPRSLRTAGHGPTTLALAEMLGLQGEVIAANPKYAFKRFLFNQGRITPLPSSLFQAMTNPMVLRAVPAVVNDLRLSPMPELEDEPVYTFFERHFNKYVVETFIEPLIFGIYATSSRNLSIRNFMSTALSLQQRHGSLLLGIMKDMISRRPPSPSSSSSSHSDYVQKMIPSRVFSFRGGLKTLTTALADKCTAKGVSLQLERTAVHISPVISPSSSPRARVTFDDGSQVDFDHVISALPAHSLRTLLSRDAPSISSLLNKVNFSSLAVVNVGYEGDVLPAHLRGFGYLVPPSERQSALGVIFDSATFPEQGSGDQTRFTVMLGGSGTGASEESIRGKSDSQIEQLAVETLHKHLAASCPASASPSSLLNPAILSVKRCNEAIAQYAPGHIPLVKKIEDACNATFKGTLTVLGNSFYGVGVNDCVYKAKEVASAIKLT